MDNIGWFFLIFVAFLTAFVLLMGLIDRWTQPKTSYEKWLEIELKRNPDYIDWLRVANNGKDYKLGLRILRKLKKGKI